MDHHALQHHVVAGGDQALDAFHLHHAHAAGGDLVDALQVAQMGMGMPAAWAASRMVVPVCTETERPSMIAFTIFPHVLP